MEDDGRGREASGGCAGATEAGVRMTTPFFSTPLSQPLPRQLKKKRVLLIDTSNTRDLRAEVMRKLGMDVDTAADLMEARAWWRANLYGLVIMNMHTDVGGRDQFCEDLRTAKPPQQLAFLVGKPDYLGDAPNGQEGSAALTAPAVSNGGNGHAKVGVPSPLADGSPVKWGILEASRQISAVRSLAHARTKAVRERPAPARDAEIRVFKRATEPTTLDQLLKEEMR
jgi:CheY-like chemotaxis protein